MSSSTSVEDCVSGRKKGVHAREEGNVCVERQKRGVLGEGVRVLK